MEIVVHVDETTFRFRVREPLVGVEKRLTRVVFRFVGDAVAEISMSYEELRELLRKMREEGIEEGKV